MTAISRKQAWCKLAVLIADGAPTPSEIRFINSILTMTVDSGADAATWASHVNLEPPRHSKTTTWFGEWQGFDVYPPDVPVTEDMSQVREIAGTVSE